MKSIFTEVLYAMEKGEDTALVTIVDEGGSVPRGTGSQMLVGTKGRIVGTIGGGAVENQSKMMALRAINSKSSLSHEFLLRENETEDIGMVCGGDVTVWFQFIPANDPVWKAAAEAVLSQGEKRKGGLLVLDLESGVSVADEDGKVLAGCEVPSECMNAEHNGSKIGNRFAMPLPLGEMVYVFGGGHIARALVPLLHTVGFRVTVFDNRSEYAEAADFPQAEKVICGDYERLSDYVNISGEDYIVVMTNGHSHDFIVQEQILRQSFAYIGVIGSSRKTAAVNAKLMEAGIPKEATELVHTPIGTKIKAVTPEEIAVSIAGEMILVRATRREEIEQPGRKKCPMH